MNVALIMVDVNTAVLIMMAVIHVLVTMDILLTWIIMDAHVSVAIVTLLLSL